MNCLRSQRRQRPLPGLFSSHRDPSRAPYRPRVEGLEVRTLLSAGDLDPTFGIGGRVLTDIGQPASDEARSVTAVQSDGDVIVVGTTSQSPNQILVARYNADGSLDAGFGDQGVEILTFGNVNDVGFGVAVDGQGRIIVAGYSYQSDATGYDFAVARLSAQGHFDTTFDGDGRTTIDFGSLNDFGLSMALDSQDRVVVAGYSYQNGSSGADFAVARLDVQGQLDTSFAGGGRATIDFGNTFDVGQSVAVDSQDRVVVAGYSFQQSDSPDLNFAVARLDVQGELDTTFDGDGRALVDFGSTSDVAFGVAADAQDRVVIAGQYYESATGYQFAVARLDAQGQLDITFSGDGRALIDFDGTVDRGQSVAIDGQGRVVVAGSSYPSDATGYDFAVARLDAQGQLDNAFDGDGRTTVDFGLGIDFGTGVAVDDQDRVFVAGSSAQAATLGDVAVASLRF